MTAEQREHEGLSRLPPIKAEGLAAVPQTCARPGGLGRTPPLPTLSRLAGGTDGAGGAARRRTQPPLFVPLDEAERVPNFEGDRRVRAAPRSCFDLAVLRVYGTDAGFVTRAFIVIPPSVR